jgi:outer membrane immunogenic protein
MRFKFAALAAAAAVAFAAPAQAQSEAEEGTRAEVRSGVFFGHGVEEAVAGLAIGHDFDLTDTLFVGAQASMDKVLDGDFNRTSVGIVGRLGASFDATSAYALGGYQTNPCSGCVSALTAGAGLQHDLSDTLYVKGEYRHLFSNHSAPEFDVVLLGVGVQLR